MPLPSPAAAAAALRFMSFPFLFTGRGATFWNLYLSDQRAVLLPECGYGPLLNFVGKFGGSQVGAWVGGCVCVGGVRLDLLVISTG